MAIAIVTPAPPRSRKGNRVTALRWAWCLRRLGEQPFVTCTWSGRPCELMVALHARHSHASILRFRTAHPRAALVVALTGTDLYADLGRHREVAESLSSATLLVALQPLARAELPPALAAKVRVVYQSARPLAVVERGLVPPLVVAVLGHLRAVKDPFLTVRALHSLPASVPIRIEHAGAALDPGAEAEACSWMGREPRYRWVGSLRHREAMARLAAAHLLVLSSQLEGGANVISEAIVHGVPVLATKIPGSVGLLGEDWPGLFPVGDAAALAGLLQRAVEDLEFRSQLDARTRALAPRFAPAREVESWRAVLAELRGSTFTRR